MLVEQKCGVAQVVDKGGLDEYGGHNRICQDNEIIGFNASVDERQGINQLPLNVIGELAAGARISEIVSLRAFS